MIIVILGLPGIGKGTQSKYISDKYGLKHLSTGDMLRDHMARKTPLGVSIQKKMDKGEFVSDEMINKMVRETLNSSPNAILDGYPRTAQQAAYLDSYTKVEKIIYLDGLPETAKKRALQRATMEKRSDDTPEVISKRIDIYYEKTMPVVEYYKKSGRLSTISSNSSISDINNKIDRLMK